MHEHVLATSEGVEACWLALHDRMGPLAALFAELRLRVSVLDACDALGVTSREALSRELVKRRLPPYRMLKNWYQVVQMMLSAEEGVSLCNLALSKGEYPAAYYRLARSTTGYSWSELEKNGSGWAKRLALHAWQPHTRFLSQAPLPQ